jgi:DNA-binding transcriptional LysR family regulator
LLLSDTNFSTRKQFDAICRVAGLKLNVVIESHAQHTKLALAEAGLGVAIISSTAQTHRYTLRTVRLTYKRKPILEPVAVVWDKRRVLPRYAQDFCEMLAAHMRKLFPIAQLPARKANGAAKRPRSRVRLNCSPH